MARRTTTYAIRLAVEGGGQVKAELVSVGQSGEQSLKRIESGGEHASGGLKGLGRQAELLRTGIRTLGDALIGVTTVGGLAALVDRSISAADAIGKTADKIGVGAEALQELRFAAKASGVEQQTLDMALQRFTRRAAEAAQGTGEAKDALAQMGIALRDQSGNLRRSEDLLADVADAFARIEDPAERVRLAFKLFDSEGGWQVGSRSSAATATHFRSWPSSRRSRQAAQDRLVLCGSPRGRPSALCRQGARRLHRSGGARFARAARREGGEGTRLWLDDLAGLLALVEIGAVELHPWNASIDDIEHPDRLVFDLDPGEGVAWEFVIETALTLRRMLKDEGLEPWPKLTGGKGLHLMAPLDPTIDHDEARAYAKRIAQRLSATAPDRYTIATAPEKRAGRIFIDYLRNGCGTTAIGAWSPRTGFPIAAPVSWRQVEHGIRPDALPWRSRRADSQRDQQPRSPAETLKHLNTDAFGFLRPWNELPALMGSAPPATPPPPARAWSCA